jgi:hypothetical protein
MAYPNSLAWNGANLYTVQFLTGDVYSIDRSSGAATRLGRLVNVNPLGQSGLAADSQGRLWGLAEDGSLFNVDESAGEASVVSTTLAAGFSSLAIDRFARGAGFADGPIEVPALPVWGIGILFALLLRTGSRALSTRAAG